jgi:hypothetical protein
MVLLDAHSFPDSLGYFLTGGFSKTARQLLETQLSSVIVA